MEETGDLEECIQVAFHLSFLCLGGSQRGQVVSSLCRLHPSDVLSPVSLPVFPSTAETENVCPCRTASFFLRSVTLKQLNRVRLFNCVSQLVLVWCFSPVTCELISMNLIRSKTKGFYLNSLKFGVYFVTESFFMLKL